MKNKQKIVLFGDGAFGEIAYEYFTYDSQYEVVAFTVNEQFITKDSHFGIPVVPFEKINDLFPPDKYAMHIALVYNNLNRLRMRIYSEAKQMGYLLVNYISSRTFKWHNVIVGDNVFVFEDNTIQPFVSLGSNIILWSGNHIGHHSTIADHNFISSHVVISGFCNVGESCFIGVNSTVANNVNIGKDCFIGAGVLVTKNLPDASFVKGLPQEIDAKNTYLKFRLT